MGSQHTSKRIVSISLGSSARDAHVVLELGGIKFSIERRGTDGSLAKARQLLSVWDGNADAIGLGGTDLYLNVGKKRYIFRESADLIKKVRKTPVLDGSGLKDSLERRLIMKLAAGREIPLKKSRVLLVCAADRFGMAEALEASGAKVTLGDLIYALNVDVPLHSLQSLARWARLLAPVITKLPVRWLYPIGSKQELRKPRFPKYFLGNDIIAGDFHYIKRYMPASLPGKIIITNTVTALDRAMLKDAGVSTLITTTPAICGRSFGTNVMEALLVALKGKGGPLAPEEYLQLLDFYHIEPSVEHLNS